MCDCDYDPPTFYNANRVKGRAEYTCDECLCQIPKGEEHLYVSGLWEGDFLTFRTCLTCVEMAEEAGVKCYCHGQLMDAVDVRDGVASVQEFFDRRRENYERRKATQFQGTGQ